MQHGVQELRFRDFGFSHELNLFQAQNEEHPQETRHGGAQLGLLALAEELGKISIEKRPQDPRGRIPAPSILTRHGNIAYERN